MQPLFLGPFRQSQIKYEICRPCKANRSLFPRRHMPRWPVLGERLVLLACYLISSWQCSAKGARSSAAKCVGIILLEIARVLGIFQWTATTEHSAAASLIVVTRHSSVRSVMLTFPPLIRGSLLLLLCALNPLSKTHKAADRQHVGACPCSHKATDVTAIPRSQATAWQQRLQDMHAKPMADLEERRLCDHQVLVPDCVSGTSTPHAWPAQRLIGMLWDVFHWRDCKCRSATPKDKCGR